MGLCKTDALSLGNFAGDTLSPLFCEELLPSCDSYIIEVAEADSPPRDEEACPRLPLLGLLFLPHFVVPDEEELRDFTKFKTFFIFVAITEQYTITEINVV